jgi:ArsR family transcriptional regulator
MLLTQGELCVCDIMAVLEETQSKVSRHIAYLKNSGLIQGKRVGTWMHYHLKDNLDGLPAAHVDFLKKQLSGLEWVKADATKMKEIQADKLCDAAAASVKEESAARKLNK